ncbi:drug/metabolite exporter YedA [Myxococcus sp. CA056]|nr:drug/metabolite exporter YedA [Myxococcus sp. CA056]NTX11418.1 drug/metabolite exporter YedA [Myxococcus sp. CA056]
MRTWPVGRSDATSRATVSASSAASSLSTPSTPALSPVAAPVAGDALQSGASRGRILLCLVTLYLVWGSTYLAIRWVLQGGMTPFLASGTRFLLAGALLFGAMWLKGSPVPTARQWGSSAVVGLLLLGVGNGGLVFAQQWVPSGVAALVVGSLPMWSALFGGLFGQWPGKLERWGLAVGFGGIILLNLGGELGGSGWATLALLVSPMSWALGSVLGRRMPMPQGMMAPAAQMLCGGALMLTFGLLRGEHLTAMPDARALAAFAYLVTFGSLVGYTVYGYLMRHTSPSVATSYAYVNPVVAVLLGVVFAGESMSPLSWVAMAAILGAVVLLTRKR